MNSTKNMASGAMDHAGKMASGMKDAAGKMGAGAKDAVGKMGSDSKDAVGKMTAGAKGTSGAVMGAAGVAAGASGEPMKKMGNSVIDLTKVALPSESVHGKKYVPLFASVQAMGGSVEWDNTTKKATVSGIGGVAAVLSKDSSTAESGEKKMELDGPMVLMNGKTLVPATFFTKSLGQKVKIN